MKQKVVTNSFEETQRLGTDFATRLHAGDVMLLYGNLGAGKTTFMQGLAKGLGIEKRIISPTFIIVRTYELNLKQKTDMQNLYHVDLYRTQTDDDLKSVGLPEILEDKNSVVAIEWPEKSGSFFPEKRYQLHFERIDENTRSITIEKYE